MPIGSIILIKEDCVSTGIIGLGVAVEGFGEGTKDGASDCPVDGSGDGMKEGYDESVGVGS